MAQEPDPKPPSGVPEPPERHPENHAASGEPHHGLNNPVGEPDPTEWPDPYDQREDPRDPQDDLEGELPLGQDVHPQTGSQSTSEPNPKQDPEAEPWAEGPKRDKLDN